jgi:hypothetical protein
MAKGKNKVIDSEAGSDMNANDSGKNPALIYGPIVGVFSFAAIAGIIYAVLKKEAPLLVRGDEFSTSSIDTSL